MLVLSRQRGETVMIGDSVDVTIIDVRGEKVRLGINAPRDVAVHRKEIYEQIKEQNRSAAQLKTQDVPQLGNKPTPVSAAGGMTRPESSNLFQVSKDPSSGVESFILSTRVAPLQQSLYFTQSAMSRDGRYLWFYCAFPPGGDADYGRTLGVVDFQEQDVRHFPETQFGSASPWLDTASGDIYWCTGPEIYRRSPRRGDQPARIARYDDAANAGPSVASRLSRSADGKWFSIDAHFDDRWHVGAAAADASRVEVWHSFDHPTTAQFSPTEAGLMLAVEQVGDGSKLYLLRRGEKPAALLPARETSNIQNAWWGGDGKSIWFIDRETGVGRVNVDGSGRQRIGLTTSGSAQVDASGRYLVADAGARILFHDLETGKEAVIVSSLSQGPSPRQQYATSPNPQFCGNGRYVCYTTSVTGKFDLAITPVELLANITRA